MYKNKKYTLLLIAVFLTTTLLQAQNTSKINWGKETSKPAGTMLSKIVSWNKDGFYALRIKENIQSSINRIILNLNPLDTLSIQK